MDYKFLFKPYVVWFLLGLFFMLLEFITPGLVILFFGVGAWITALVAFIFNIGINVQLAIFVSTSILSLIFLRKLLKDKLFNKVDNEIENTDAILDDFSGHKAKVIVDIEKNGQGRVNYKGTSWLAEADCDIKKDENVVIISKESTVLKVKPIK